ncbi:MAG: prolyl oligopeptidase family serine peptidase [Pirellulales bacterium]
MAAVVPFYAPFDLVMQTEHRKEMGSMTPLLGVTELNDEGRRTLLAASPSTQVHAGMPPYLLIHGDADSTVPYEQSPKFQKLMQDAGNTCDLIRVPGGGHGMGGWAKLDTDYQQQLIAWLRKTMK